MKKPLCCNGFKEDEILIFTFLYFYFTFSYIKITLSTWNYLQNVISESEIPYVSRAVVNHTPKPSSVVSG